MWARINSRHGITLYHKEGDEYLEDSALIDLKNFELIVIVELFSFQYLRSISIYSPHMFYMWTDIYI